MLLVGLCLLATIFALDLFVRHPLLCLVLLALVDLAACTGCVA